MQLFTRISTVKDTLSVTEGQEEKVLLMKRLIVAALHLTCFLSSSLFHQDGFRQLCKDTVLTLLEPQTFSWIKPSQYSAMGNPENDTCHYKQWIDPDKTPTISAIMFAAGIIGNVAALVILEVRRCRDSRNGGGRRRSLFHILITSLVVTDLTGTCLISPLVQLSYHQNKTLTEMTHSKSVCRYFGLSMTFFSLATMALLLTTALERCLAIGYPYFYNRHVTKKCAYITIPVVFLLCTLFCLLPFAGFGAYVQYCPGTWCFIDMNPKETVHRVYANLYASVMLLLVLAIVSCNGFVVYQLYKMYQRRRRNGGSVISTKRSHNERRSTSMAEEVEHLILLVFMTIIFIICTLPLVVRWQQNTHMNALKVLTVDFWQQYALFY